MFNTGVSKLFSGAAFSLALAVATTTATALAQDPVNGTCAISSNAPAVVEKALNEVLQRFVNPNPDTLPDAIKKFYAPQV